MPRLEAVLDRGAEGTRVTMVTAYDATTAALVEESAVDMVLVGDSLGVAMLGYDSPDRVTIDEMVHHTGAVARAVEETVVVADIPLGVDSTTPERTVQAATRLRNEAGADAVKLEGRGNADAIASIDAAGIPPLGHLGTAAQTDRDRRSETPALVDAAETLDRAGAVGIVLKRLPRPTAAAVTDAVDAVTLGIAAGPHCDGQVLTIHDLLGLGDLVPGSADGIAADLGPAIVDCLDRYHRVVLAGDFPAADGRDG